MLTIQDLADLLGTTVRGLRLRLELLDDLVLPYCRRGPKNEILVDQGGVALLQRLEELRKSRGLPLREAVRVVREEFHGNGGGDKRQTREGVTLNQVEGDERLWPLKMLVEELRRANENLQKERDHWRDLTLRLQQQVEELQRLALPAPRANRPWWARGIFRWLWSG